MAFILLHVYQIVPQLIRGPSDLPRDLLRLHFAGRVIPEALADWLVERLAALPAFQGPTFQGWPLRDIVTDPSLFHHFLQDRWLPFLYRSVGLAPPADGPDPWPELPFGQPEVRVFIDTLFLDGTLTPVSFPHADAVTEDWARVGLVGGGAVAMSDRLAKLLDRLERDLPAEDARFRAWSALDPHWPRRVALCGPRGRTLNAVDARHRFWSAHPTGLDGRRGAAGVVGSRHRGGAA